MGAGVAASAAQAVGRPGRTAAGGPRAALRPLQPALPHRHKTQVPHHGFNLAEASLVEHELSTFPFNILTRAIFT